MIMIEIEEEVFEQLQALAKPLIDTPNDVIKRLIQDRSGGIAVSSPTSPRAPTTGAPRRIAPARKHGEGIQMLVYRPYILKVLLDEGGRAHLSKVKEYIKRKLGHRFDQHDVDYTQSNAVVWENRVEWQRLVMRQEGLIAPDSPRGIWELTEKGLKEARKVNLD